MASRLGLLFTTCAMIGTLLSAACSTGPASPPPVSESSATTMKPYGSLTIATDLGAGQIDPQLATATSFFFTTVAIFDTLVFYDARNQLQPGIAERWEISSDGRTHTFYIRKGVKFHDGSALTGADVKFTIERMLAPEGLNPDALIWRAAVASVQLKDDYTVLLNLKAPQYELLRGHDGGTTAVAPKKYIEEKGVDYFRKNLVGSGPWKVVSYVPGDRLELEALESHWRAVPKFKNITLLHIKEEGSKVPMLKTGELDMAQITSDSVAGLKSAGVRVVNWSGGGQYFGFPFYDQDHSDKYLFGDVRVRKALQVATNSKEIADMIFGGYAEPYAVYAIDPTAYFFDPNVLKPDPYDPEGAKKLLAEAGQPNGFRIKINDIGGGGIISTIDLALSGYWRKIGVDAEVIPIDYGAFWPKFNPKHQPEVWDTVYVNMGSVARHFDKMTSLHSTKSSSKPRNPQRLDELIDKVPTMPQSPEKTRLALEAAVLAKNEYSVLRIVSPHLVLGLGSKINDLARLKASYISGLMLETITHAK